jgi:predicted  nucleic acid-binding Zn-ribbon protein
MARAAKAADNAVEIRTRLADLAARETAQDAALLALTTHRQELVAALEALLAESQALATQRIPRTRALLASVAGLAAERETRRQLDALEDRRHTLGEEIQRARAELTAHEAQSTAEQERIAADRAELLTTRADLEALVAAFLEESHQAHLDAGQAVTARLQAARQLDQEALVRAEAEVERIRASIEQHQAEARAQLAPYPQALQAAQGTPLLPMPPAPAERILTAYDAWLSVLEAQAGTGDPLAGPIVVSAIVGTLTPHHVAAILTTAGGAQLARERRRQIRDALTLVTHRP